MLTSGGLTGTADGIESPVMRPRMVHKLRMDVAQATQVALRGLNGGDGNTCDPGAWGFARFIEAGAKDQLEQTE